MLAAYAGHTEIVRVLLAHGSNVNFACGDGFTALTHACERGHWEIVLHLAENGADFAVSNATGRNGFDYLKSWRCRSKRMRAKIEAKIALHASKEKEA
jgi:ankyrin repeat protein